MRERVHGSKMANESRRVAAFKTFLFPSLIDPDASRSLPEKHLLA